MTQAAAGGRGGCIKAAAIVRYAHLDKESGAVCRDLHMVGACMLKYIGQYFLNDSHELQGLRRTQPAEDRQILHVPLKSNPGEFQALSQTETQCRQYRCQIAVQWFQRADYGAQVINAIQQQAL